MTNDRLRPSIPNLRFGSKGRRAPSPEVSSVDFFGGLRSFDAAAVRDVLGYLELLSMRLDGVSIGVISKGDAATKADKRQKFPESVDLYVLTSSASLGEENGQLRLAANDRIMESLLEYSAQQGMRYDREPDSSFDKIVLLQSEGKLPIRVFVTHPFMYPDYPRYMKGLRENPVVNDKPFVVLL